MIYMFSHIQLLKRYLVTQRSRRVPEPISLIAGNETCLVELNDNVETRPPLRRFLVFG